MSKYSITITFEAGPGVFPAAEAAQHLAQVLEETFTRGGQDSMGYDGPSAYKISHTVQTPLDYAAIAEAVAATEAAAEGDSNDTEIQALQELVELLLPTA